MVKKNNSIGIVQTQSITFDSDSQVLALENGEVLTPVTLAYETYGTLNSDKSNAILVVHGLSGDAHAAGKHSEDAKPGWWDNLIGPGKGLNTDKYFVISSNVIGGCQGSSGPTCIDLKTNKPYGMNFPVVTIKDMVNAQKLLIDYLGIEVLHSVIGGSMGGMQVLEWSISYPERIKSAIPLATTARHSAQAIAFNEVGRQAIISDPNWQNGDYYGKNLPQRGLAVARMIGHITYLSDFAMHQKFGRRLQDKQQLAYDFSAEFQVESYLRHQGGSFIKRFDPNSYLYITKALDYFDLVTKYDGLVNAFKDVQAKFLIVAYSSDWLYPSSQSLEIVNALRVNLKDVTYFEVNSKYGHDAFLLENDQTSPIIEDFLRHVK